MAGFLTPSSFTLDDFRRLLDQTQHAGPLGVVADLLPGVSTTEETVERQTQAEFNRIKGIIDSMTPQERCDPVRLLDESRLRRIARGAGVRPGAVRDLVRQFHGMAEIMEQLARSRRPRTGRR